MGYAPSEDLNNPGYLLSLNFTEYILGYLAKKPQYLQADRKELDQTGLVSLLGVHGTLLILPLGHSIVLTSNLLTLCMLDNLSSFCCCLLTFFKNTFKVSIYLDPYQDQHSVCLDLGSNCFERLSVDDKNCH